MPRSKKDNTKSAKETTPSTKSAPLKASVTAGFFDSLLPIEEGTTLDTVYILDGSANRVTLEINVGGEEQTSDMTVKIDRTVLAEALAGDFKRKIIGTNSGLPGKKLSIVATIADTSRKHNFTSLTIRLTGGVADTDFPLAKTVNKEGESADYLCLIEFFTP